MVKGQKRKWVKGLPNQKGKWVKGLYNQKGKWVKGLYNQNQKWVKGLHKMWAKTYTNCTPTCLLTGESSLPPLTGRCLQSDNANAHNSRRAPVAVVLTFPGIASCLSSPRSVGHTSPAHTHR